MTKYGVIVGSIRKNSYSKGVAEAIVAGLPDDAEVTYLNIAKLPEIPEIDWEATKAGLPPQTL